MLNWCLCLLQSYLNSAMVPRIHSTWGVFIPTAVPCLSAAQEKNRNESRSVSYGFPTLLNYLLLLPLLWIALLSESWSQTALEKYTNIKRRLGGRQFGEIKTQKTWYLTCVIKTLVVVFVGMTSTFLADRCQGEQTIYC